MTSAWMLAAWALLGFICTCLVLRGYVNQAIRTVRSTAHHFAAYVVCGSSSMRYVACQRGAARLKRPRDGQLHIVKCLDAKGHSVVLLWRQQHAPHTATVLGHMANVEANVLLAKLYVNMEGNMSRDFDISHLMYYVPQHLHATPRGVARLVVGSQVVDQSVVSAQVRVFTIESMYHYESEDIIDSTEFAL